MIPRIRDGRLPVLLVAMALLAPGGRAEILRVKLGGRAINGTLHASLSVGAPVFAEVDCSPGDVVEIQLTRFADLSDDGKVQPNEVTIVARVAVEDNLTGTAAVDLDRRRGKILVKLVPLVLDTTALTLRASTKNSARSAVMRIRPATRKPDAWWHRFDRLLDIAPILRMPDEHADICVLDVTRWVVTPISTPDRQVASPSISHDEQQIAYGKRDGGKSSVIIRSRADGNLIMKIEAGAWPVWTPGDDGVAFIRNRSAILRRFKGGEEISLGFRADRLLFARDRSGGRLELMVIRDVEGTDVPYHVECDLASHAICAEERLHFGADAERFVSPTGDRVLTRTSNGELSIVERTGSIRPIPNRGTVADPSWSPSGRILTYVCEQK